MVEGNALDEGARAAAMKRNTGENSAVPANAVPALAATVVMLRNGQAVEGRLHDVGGTHPLRITVNTSNGARDFSSNDVAQIFLATPPGQACCDAKGNVPPDPEILGQGVGAGIRKDDTALKEKLNAAIRSAAAAGDFERITKN